MDSTSQQIRVEKFDPQKCYDFDKFDCGDGGLNGFLQNELVRQAEKGTLVAYLCIIESDQQPSEVVGFFTLSSSSLERNVFTNKCRKDLVYKSAPCILLGRIAVCKSVQKQGVGKWLLGLAIKKAIQSSSDIGVYALALHAEEHNWPFYRGAGFTQSQHGERKLFVYPLKQGLKHYIEENKLDRLS
ncbi:GNAT family N-acetyltransferase [Salinivibrio costicola]|uniref:N-acetyltransferase n=1 Tax=Salinivibrio costicola subsp. alcaliphilus TaxID=272773 RepID=A0ABX3KSX0_SALCS|nr:GNAT family N-acetyltransferase [Salinivibrio costicola]OOF34547.1 N-acetyltransferase [Salinivibrio costicola subsp. alcaliphilus]